MNVSIDQSHMLYYSNADCNRIACVHQSQSFRVANEKKQRPCALTLDRKSIPRTPTASREAGNRFRNIGKSATCVQYKISEEAIV
eukprot:2998286-Prorocentrum_lima.AAC.1